MRTTPPPRPASPTPPSRPNGPRNRPGKGIDVPATVWLPPVNFDADCAPATSAILPAWALRRLCAEYTAPGRAVMIGDTDALRGGQRQTAFRALRGPHGPRRGAAIGLAILEIDTDAPTTTRRDRRISLTTDILRAALCEAADALELGGILAIALAAPEVGHAVQGSPAVVRAARTAGFTYQQHIVIVTGDLDGERLIARLTDAQARDVTRARAAGIPAAAPAHLDLTIFTNTTKDTCA